MPYKDPAKERACACRRYERITAERTARGMCPRCGVAKPVPDRTLCRPCGEKRRKAERARHAKAKAAGILYGGRDAERCRRSARDRSKQRDRARRDAGLCTRCGTNLPLEGGTVCEPCRELKRESEREHYARRRAAGKCGKCGAPAPDGSARCECCARSAAKHSRKKAKNARSRQIYGSTASTKALFRLRRTIPGRGAMSSVCPPVLGTFGRVSRSADPATAIHGHRDCHRSRSRHMGKLG